jgi:hypothetical protein
MDPGDYIALSAAVIALASLYTSVRQTQLTREHNKLSVRPLLMIYRKQFENHPVEYVLENRGLGPAIISKFSVMVDDREVKSANDNVLLCALDILGLSRNDVGGHLPGEEMSLVAGQAVSLLKFGRSMEDSTLYKSLMDKLPRLKFEITYQSMYDDEFSYTGNGD